VPSPTGPASRSCARRAQARVESGASTLREPQGRPEQRRDESLRAARARSRGAAAGRGGRPRRRGRRRDHRANAPDGRETLVAARGPRVCWRPFVVARRTDAGLQRREIPRFGTSRRPDYSGSKSSTDHRERSATPTASGRAWLERCHRQPSRAERRSRSASRRIRRTPLARRASFPVDRTSADFKPADDVARRRRRRRAEVLHEDVKEKFWSITATPTPARSRRRTAMDRVPQRSGRLGHLYS